jgi:hypothetical protein
MPLYTFENIKTGELRDVHFRMLDEKIYNGEGGTEVGEWKRIFYVPQVNMGLKIDPFSSKSFLDKTKNAKTYGEAWDISKEFSDARADKIGAPDPQREKAEDKFYRNKNKR